MEKLANKSENLVNLPLLFLSVGGFIGVNLAALKYGELWLYFAYIPLLGLTSYSLKIFTIYKSVSRKNQLRLVLISIFSCCYLFHGLSVFYKIYEVKKPSKSLFMREKA